MSKKIRSRLSKILIGTGLFVLLFLLVVEAASFPWHALLSEYGILEQERFESMGDPPSLPEELLQLPSKTKPQTPENDPEELIAPPQNVLVRPQIPLTYLGTIKIPAISISENVVSGTGDEMYYGVGHMPSTALPGQAGNCALAAHRNLLYARAFRHLDKLVVGDEIFVTVDDTTYRYLVYESIVVEPSENWVLKLPAGETHVLSLITCTPVLNATHRLIVRARLEGTPVALQSEPSPDEPTDIAPEETENVDGEHRPPDDVQDAGIQTDDFIDPSPDAEEPPEVSDDTSQTDDPDATTDTVAGE